METLTIDECRVLGVLVEKELTTPEQYPLTINAIVNGCNQKNNRDPVMELDEGRVFEAVEELRGKGMVIRTESAGSRVPRFKHQITEKLGITRYELVILAELMLRGPQTLGELRGRASRMHHLDSLEVVREMLDKLRSREEPLVKELPPAPGSRAERYMQLLCPTEIATAEPVSRSETPAGQRQGDRVSALEARVAALETAIRKLATAVGEQDPLQPG